MAGDAFSPSTAGLQAAGRSIHTARRRHGQAILDGAAVPGGNHTADVVRGHPVHELQVPPEAEHVGHGLGAAGAAGGALVLLQVVCERVLSQVAPAADGTLQT